MIYAVRQPLHEWK